jgi:hypothetical protein
LRDVISHHVPLATAEEMKIWEKQKAIKKASEVTMPEDELVEDADLSDDSVLGNRQLAEVPTKQLSLI